MVRSCSANVFLRPSNLAGGILRDCQFANSSTLEAARHCTTQGVGFACPLGASFFRALRPSSAAVLRHCESRNIARHLRNRGVSTLRCLWFLDDSLVASRCAGENSGCKRCCCTRSFPGVPRPGRRGLDGTASNSWDEANIRGDALQWLRDVHSIPPPENTMPSTFLSLRRLRRHANYLAHVPGPQLAHLTCRRADCRRADLIPPAGSPPSVTALPLLLPDPQPRPGPVPTSCPVCATRR
jgi:hypothetical protein